MYQASTKLFVSTMSTDGSYRVESALSRQNSSLFSQERVKSYADIVNSLPVTTAVVQELNPPETPQQLAAKDHGDCPA